jgi:hypothetical protein
MISISREQFLSIRRKLIEIIKNQEKPLGILEIIEK